MKIRRKVSLSIEKFVSEKEGIYSKTIQLKLQIEYIKVHNSIIWKHLKKYKYYKPQEGMTFEDHHENKNWMMRKAHDYDFNNVVNVDEVTIYGIIIRHRQWRKIRTNRVYRKKWCDKNQYIGWNLIKGENAFKIDIQNMNSENLSRW